MRKHGGGIAVCIILAFLLMFSCLCLSLQAEEADPAVGGTIRITLLDSNDQSVISGTQFALYKIANVVINGDRADYEYTSEFSLCGIALYDVFSEDFVKAAASYAQNNNLAGKLKTADETGTVTFSSVPKGLYLIREAGFAPERMTSEPFTVCVPMKEKDKAGWNYDIHATPKAGKANELKHETSLTVQKIWNSGGQSVPQSVSVSLLRGEKKVDTVLLSEKNNWTYTWTHLDNSAVWDVREEPVPAGYAVHYSRNGERIIITNVNTAKSFLVQTGRVLWRIFALAGAGLALILAGLWLLRRKGRK